MESFVVSVGASFAIIISTFLNYPITPSYCTVGSIIGAVLADNLINWQKFKKGKHVKKCLLKIVYILPFIVLLGLY